jgi:hypothetical protein
MIVFVGTPYDGMSKAEITRNVEYARAVTRFVAEQGHCPVAVQLYIHQCLYMGDDKERADIAKISKQVLSRCDVALFVNDYGLDDEMKSQIQFCVMNDIRYRVCFMEEVFVELQKLTEEPMIVPATGGVLLKNLRK